MEKIKHILADSAKWNFFWISGLGIILLYFLSLLSGKSGEEFEYFAFMFGCPSLALCAYSLSKYWVKPSKVDISTTILLGLALLLCCFNNLSGSYWIPFLFSFIQILFLYAAQKIEQPSSAFYSFILSFLIWTFAQKLIWWEAAPQHWLYPNLVLFFAFGFSNVFFFTESKGKSWLIHIACIAWLIRASFRVDFDFHHLSGYTGPVSLMKQGGVLLWDVPSFYGFLNIAFISAMPVESPWQAMYYANAITLVIGSLVYYFVLQKTFSGILGQIFSFLFTFVFLFLLPGLAPTLAGPNAFPMAGPFRFIWVYLLLWNTCFAPQRFKVLLGNLFWLLSAFWSAESFAYATAIWFPFYFLQYFLPQPKFKTLIQMALPIGTLVIAHALIYFFYIQNFAHPPDWYNFVETAVAFRKGFDCILINPKGSIWILYFLFILHLLMAVKSGLERSSGFAVAVASLLGSWLVTSYFVGRSHENNALNCLPVILYCLILSANATKFFEYGTREEKLSFKLVLIPLFSICMMFTIGHRVGFSAYFKNAFEIPSASQMDERIPMMSEEAAALMNRAGVKTSDSIVQLDRLYPLPRHPKMETPPDPKLWLPVMPEYHFCGVVTPDRIRLYFERYLKDVKRGGWLLVRKNGDEMHCLANRKIISEFYNQTKSFESEQWYLDYYEPKL